MASINSNVFKVCITFEGCGFYYHSKDISYDREKAFFFFFLRTSQVWQGVDIEG